MNATVDVLPYYGSFLAAHLLSAQTTLVLSSFGGTINNANLVDTNGNLAVGEIVQINGTNVTVLGSGTAQPGINVLGLTIPTGSAVDMVLVQDQGGTMYFVFPGAMPNATGMIALVVDLDPIGYSLTTMNPLCIAEGTELETPSGPRLVEDLCVGELVQTGQGEALPILHITRETRAVTEETRKARAPFVIPAGHFGQGLPRRALRLSPQHRVVAALRGAGMAEVLVTARHLCDPMICAKRLCPRHPAGSASPCASPQVLQSQELGKVTYFNLLLPRHATVIAEGCAVESLLASLVVRRKFAALGIDLRAAQQPCLRLLTKEGLREQQRLRSRKLTLTKQKTRP